MKKKTFLYLSVVVCLVVVFIAISLKLILEDSSNDSKSNNEYYSESLQKEYPLMNVSDQVSLDYLMKKKVEELKEKFKKAPLKEIIPKPETPKITNRLIFEKYNIDAPIVYSSYEDFFNLGLDGELDYSSYKDTSSLSSSVQQKMREGVLHLAITQNPGELGSSHFVGHSSCIHINCTKNDSVFLTLVQNGEVGDVFIIYDKDGRELKFRVFEALEIEADIEIMYNADFGGRRVVTLQTSLPDTSKRWVVRGELVWEQVEIFLDPKLVP